MKLMDITITNGYILALLSVILLAVMPASAQVSCGDITNPTRCYAFIPQSLSNPQGPASTSAWVSAKSNSFLSGSVASTCANSPILLPTGCKSPGGTAFFSTLPVTQLTSWAVTVCIATPENPTFQLVTVIIGDDSESDTYSGGCGYIGNWTSSAGPVTARITVYGGTATATVSLTKD